MSFTLDNRFCLIHVPKSGGTSVEYILRIVHEHSPLNQSKCAGRRVVTLARDPLDRYRSSYEYCRRFPWDHQLWSLVKHRATNNRPGFSSAHCCHSSRVKRMSFSEWLRAIVHNGLDCRMTEAGYPMPFLSPINAWGEAFDDVVRTHCLEEDFARVFAPLNKWQSGRLAQGLKMGGSSLGYAQRAPGASRQHTCKMVDESIWSTAMSREGSHVLDAAADLRVAHSPRRFPDLATWRSFFCNETALRASCAKMPGTLAKRKIVPGERDTL